MSGPGALLVAATLPLLAGLVACQPRAGRDRVAAPDRPDIVVLVLDSLRGDELERARDGVPVMPRSAAWSARQVSFLNAQAPTSSTPTSVSALFSSLPLPAFGGDFVRGVPDAAPVVAELLAGAGYDTRAYSANPNCASALGHARGFGSFLEAFRHPDLARGPRIRQNHPARIVPPDLLLDRVISELDPASPSPYFAYVHLLQPHAPYTPPAEHLSALRVPSGDVPLDLRQLSLLDRTGRLDPALFAPLRAHYDAHAHYVDDAVGSFLERLAEHPRFSAAAVLLISDHGEGFGEHGRILHNTTAQIEMIHIPLVLRLAGPERAPARVEIPVGLIDVAPTLCKIAGIAPPPTFQGVDLGALASNPERYESRPLLSASVSGEHQIALRLGSFRLIRGSARSATIEQLYDLASDPRESSNLAAIEPARREALAALLDSELVRLRGLEIGRAPPISIDEERMEILRSLGYADALP